jgi:hypothetical protein
MELNQVYTMYKTMEKENILLSFKGVVTSDLLSSVLQIMESKMTYMEESPKTKKKVFNVLVECLQNLYHHIDINEIDSPRDFLATKSALFIIAKDETGFQIRTGNYIEASSAEDLKYKLDKINNMDKDELKLYYQEVLNEGSVSDKGTAGLGLIDIARKSGNKLHYEMIPVDADYQFFCLNVQIQ